MNGREHSDMPPAPSYPSPNAAQVGQGTMQYYSRQLTTDELLSAELSRETSGANLQDGGSNGMHHGQSMVLGSSNPGAPEMGRPQSADQQQQHMLQFTPNQQVGVDPNHDLSYGDQSARRKRSKVSRACDECRRKKVRCDATSESGVETCSNCRRLGVPCQFSRVPMKRGPSKGYIKELAERLNTLESQMQPAIGQADMQYQTMNEVSSPRGYQEFSPPMDGSLLSRKRTFSMSEGFPGATSFPQPTFLPRAPQSAQSALGEHTSTPDFYNQSIINGTGSVSKGNHPFWANEHDLQDNMDVTDVSKTALEEDTSLAEVDEGSLNTYYRSIHPILPILPNTKERFLELLHQCDRELQETFLQTLYAVTDTDLSRVQNTFKKVVSFDNVPDKVWHYQHGVPPLRSMAANMVWFWALIFLVLECDARGPESIRYKDPVQKAFVIQSAVRQGRIVVKNLGQLNLNLGFHRQTDDFDPNSDGSVARRGWAVVSILSRWHGISVAEEDLFGFHEIGVRQDEKILGFCTMQITRYSSILPEIAQIVASEWDLSLYNHGMGRVIGQQLMAQLQRLPEIARIPQDALENPTVKSYLETVEPLLYWTITLLMKRHLFVFTPFEVIYPAEEIIEEMHKQTANPRIRSPFDLHALALAVMTLLEATDLPQFANECWDVLEKAKQILDRREKRTAEGGEFENVFATPAWDAKMRYAIEWKHTKAQLEQAQNAIANNANSSAAPPMVGPSEQRSLQHLADLAVGAEGTAAANASSPPPVPAGDGNTAASAATAATPGPVTTMPNMQPQARVFIDWKMLTKKGYLNVFAKL